MRWNIVFGLARAEARLTRRLVRYWVFLVLATIFVVGSYFYYAVLHGLFSSYSASVGSISPKYLISGLGLWGMLLFMIGLIFLAYDVRSRDERERIAEVLDSRPYTNLEIVAGRFLGLLFMTWWPLLAMMLLLQGLGFLASALDWRVGEPVIASSVVAFSVFMAIPALSFILALAFLLSFLFRHRLATSLSLLVFLGVMIYALFQMPFDTISLMDLLGGYSLNFPSEIVPNLFTVDMLVQRGAVLAAALGLLGLAAALHPRLDNGPKNLWAGGGVALLVVAAAGLTFLYQEAMANRDRLSTWQAAHEARRGEPGPDLTKIRGELVIEPGESLSAELSIELQAPTGTDLETALFTLNPGLTVRSVTGGSGEELRFTHEEGLLEVELGSPLAAGETTQIGLTFSGRPQIYFAYLDAAVRVSQLKLTNANLILLGYEPSIFHRSFVALLPAVRWLPASGADVGRGDPGRAPDFYHLDLTVEVPDGWLIAGPGRRQTVEGGPGRSRFRFAPSAVLPEVGLVASRFVERSTEVEGVELEILVDRRHTKNLEVFADAKEEILGWIGERLRSSAEIGLGYPYGALTLVEVPTTLQAFGGGWRMDTALAPPALLLMKESSFPTSRFDNRFREPEDFEDQEGGVIRAKREVLETFFESDFNGGNVFLGAARNFFLYQTASQGTGSLALDFVCHDLANRLTTGKQGFFSAHIFGSDFQRVSQSVIGTYLTERRQGTTVADAVLRTVADQPEVWDQALGVALADMDPWEDPARTVGVLALKGKAMSRWILDGLGREKAGALLSALRAEAAGRPFSSDDLLSVAEELGIDFGNLAGDWLTATELPGFVASEPRLYRLPDSGDGTPRYQLALHLRNDEAVPGLARVRYTLADGEGSGGAGNRGPLWQESDAVRVGGGEAVEMGLVLSKPPRELRVEPYLALNRGAFAVPLPNLDEEKVVEAEAFAGVRTSDWTRQEGTDIVVDDLDPGFSVEEDEGRKGLRLGAKAQDEVLDQGLPVVPNAFQVPSDWSRRPERDAWGKYRRTLAIVRKGEGRKRAVFTAELPRSGPWRLELHMLPSRTFRWKQGTYHLTVEDESGSHELTFEAGGAEEGWNLLGELEVASGEVRVELSDETDGRAVVADAIRWRPVRSTRTEEEGTHG